MSDLISRAEAIRIAEQGQVQGFEWQFKKLCDLPSVQPRKGKWIHECVNSEYSATGCFILRSCECSECGAICEQESYFCPNCGCRMREGDSE